MTKCWKIEPAERPTFEDIYVSLQNMLMDNEVNTLILATACVLICFIKYTIL
jgi:hypothetical protein